MRYLSKGLWGVTFIVVVILVVEGGFRVVDSLSSNPTDQGIQKYMRTLTSRILQAWASREEPDPSSPPFKIFANKNWRDEARLAYVYKSSKPPTNQTWTSRDRLLPEDFGPAAEFKVTMNALGFRSPDHTKEKGERTFRILALGGDTTFGMGVPDDQTYPAALEMILNSEAKSTHYEVWNGGWRMMTAITALARLRYEIFDYQPNLLLLNLGSMDEYVADDDVIPSFLRFAPNSFFDLVAQASRWFGETALVYDYSNYKIRHPEKQEEFANTLRDILSLCRQKNVPVILIQDLRDPIKPEGADVVSVTDVLTKALHAQEFYVADERNSWIREVDSDLRDSPIFKLWPYQVDFFNLNPAGHRVLAEALAVRVIKLSGSER